MKFIRIAIVLLLALATLGVLAFAALWIFDPTSPKVEMTDPLPGGVRIEEDGIIANYFPPAGDGAHPGVLLLGGSEGGLSAGAARMAAALQGEGYAVLQLAYFRAPGQQERLELIPLERFDKAIDWLAARPEVAPGSLAIVGGSKGAEAALIVSSRRPDLRAVIAGMPSSVAWAGIDLNIARMIVNPPGSSWSLGGAPYPHLPYGRPERPGGEIIDLYRAGLADLAEHEDAIIRVENIKATVLLICGEKDALWPSCEMASQIEARAREKGGPAVEVLSYPDAGHAVFGVAVEEGDPRFANLARLGGTPAGNNAARRESWPRILDHLNRALRASEGAAED